MFRIYYPQPLSAKEVVPTAKLNGLEERLFGSLSSGPKQRVLFGLSICGHPELVLFDEPTAGMNIESRRARWD